MIKWIWIIQNISRSFELLTFICDAMSLWKFSYSTSSSSPPNAFAWKAETSLEIIVNHTLGALFLRVVDRGSSRSGHFWQRATTVLVKVLLRTSFSSNSYRGSIKFLIAFRHLTETLSFVAFEKSNSSLLISLPLSKNIGCLLRVLTEWRKSCDKVSKIQPCIYISVISSDPVDVILLIKIIAKLEASKEDP